MTTEKYGVLFLQGGAVEHEHALAAAAKKLRKKIFLVRVRTTADLAGLTGIILPGGESTTLSKLLDREKMLADLKRVPKIFGTCAGLILLARSVRGRIPGQKTLGLLDVTVDRNAYGSQQESFAAELDWSRAGARGRRSGKNIHALFIRAPRISRVGKKVCVLATLGPEREPVAVMQKNGKQFVLGATFHPELGADTKLHELFLKR